LLLSHVTPLGPDASAQAAAVRANDTSSRATAQRRRRVIKDLHGPREMVSVRANMGVVGSRV